MLKWSLIAVLLVLTSLYFMNHHYGKLYHIDPILNDTIIVTRTDQANSHNHFFSEPFNGYFEIRKPNYIVRLNSRLVYYPFLELSATNLEGSRITISDHEDDFTDDCAAFHSQKEMSGDAPSILMLSQCPKEILSSDKVRTIRFSLYEDDGNLIGKETLKVRIKHNGYYMIARGSL